MFKRNLFFGFLVGGTIFLLSSCYVQETDSQNSITTKTDTSFETSITPSITPILSTLTPTPEIKTPTQTLSPMPSATWTPLPIIPNDAQEAKMLEFSNPDFNCELPCWWGIIPGETQSTTADHILSQFGGNFYSYSNDDGTVNHDVGLSFFDPQRHFYLFINEQTEQINWIKIRTFNFNSPNMFQQDWSFFAPKTVFDKYGIPSRVWFSSTSKPGSDDPQWKNTVGYKFLFFYDDEGFVISYGGGRAEYNDTMYTICPAFPQNTGDFPIDIIEIFIKNQNLPMPVEDLFPENTKLYMLPSKKAVGLTAEEIFEVFMQEGESPCFTTPRDIWP